MSKKIYIWGEQIPGNSDKSKTDILEIHKEYSNQDLFEKYPGIWDKSSQELGDMSGNDTMVYRQEIENGPAGMTYEDKPFLVPHLVEGSDKCVLICPGGAYLSKAMVEEGEDIAAFLNAAGISAFVLWYRSYPYRAPFMYLDCQRAIRYLRYHAKDFGFDPSKIAMVGFSAGGNLVSVTNFLIRNQAVSVEGYQADAIDEMDASVAGVAGIYPAVAIEDDKIIAVLGSKDIYNTLELRQKFAKKYDVFSNVQEGDAPLFLCAAIDDEVVPVKHLVRLANIALGKNIPVELHLFSEGGHGFGGCIAEQMPQFYHDRTAVKQWKALFVNWLNRLFK
ncbi:alpha/beta hydrolase [Streptococcus equinus]|uniref:alpha/beta hydrolase n=1 Tax=Streptococcus equinus TaxID=1335 RepID=UPI003BF7FE8E